jgi:uncharacterized BrkB/YihY/UPF0761 family membrane protein
MKTNWASRIWNVTALLTCLFLLMFWSICFVLRNSPQQNSLIDVTGSLFAACGIVLGILSIFSRKHLSRLQRWSGIVLGGIIAVAVFIIPLLI